MIIHFAIEVSYGKYTDATFHISKNFLESQSCRSLNAEEAARKSNNPPEDPRPMQGKRLFTWSYET